MRHIQDRRSVEVSQAEVDAAVDAIYEEMPGALERRHPAWAWDVIGRLKFGRLRDGTYGERARELFYQKCGGNVTKLLGGGLGKFDIPPLGASGLLAGMNPLRELGGILGNPVDGVDDVLSFDPELLLDPNLETARDSLEEMVKVRSLLVEIVKEQRKQAERMEKDRRVAEKRWRWSVLAVLLTVGVGAVAAAAATMAIL